jgi:hypothetical protein
MDEIAPPPAPDRSPAATPADEPAPPPDAPVPAAAFAAPRHRNFQCFHAGQLLSLVGTWMQSTALGWLVLNLTSSELLLGVATAVASAPTVFFSLYAGPLADSPLPGRARSRSHHLPCEEPMLDTAGLVSLTEEWSERDPKNVAQEADRGHGRGDRRAHARGGRDTHR